MASAPRGPRPTLGIGTPSVQVEPARRMPMEQVAVLAGSLQPRYQVEVFPRRAGRLAGVEVAVGQRVSAGDVLATLDREELALEERLAAASVAASRLAVQSAEIRLDKLKADYERLQGLHRQGAATRQELDDLRAGLEGAQIQLEMARAQLEREQASYELLRLQLRDGQILAPVDGVVVHTPFVAGSQVTPSSVIAALAAVDPIEVVFHVPERDIGRLAVGQPLWVQVQAFPNDTFAGTVSRFEATVDPGTRTLPVRGEVPNGDLRLRAGMSARVTLVVAQAADALTVPREALVTGSGGVHVYVVEDGRAVIRPVEVGILEQERAQITAGLQEGDLVVTVGQQGLRNGQAVQAVAGGPAR